MSGCGSTAAAALAGRLSAALWPSPPTTPASTVAPVPPASPGPAPAPTPAKAAAAPPPMPPPLSPPPPIALAAGGGSVPRACVFPLLSAALFASCPAECGTIPVILTWQVVEGFSGRVRKGGGGNRHGDAVEVVAAQEWDDGSGRVKVGKKSGIKSDFCDCACVSASMPETSRHTVSLRRSLCRQSSLKSTATSTPAPTTCEER